MSISRSSTSVRVIGRLVRLKPTSQHILHPHLRASPLSASAPRAVRNFTTSWRCAIDILPDADKPEGEVKQSEPHNVIKEATPMTDSEYQEKSDRYFEGLLNRLEEMQEEKGGSMDVEYAVSCSILYGFTMHNICGCCKIQIDLERHNCAIILTSCSRQPVVVYNNT